MKLLKKMALLSLCVFALSGCTQSSVTADSIMIKEDMVAPDGSQMVEEDIVVDRTMKVTKETDPYVFDWDQISEDAVEMFEI